MRLDGVAPGQRRDRLKCRLQAWWLGAFVLSELAVVDATVYASSAARKLLQNVLTMGALAFTLAIPLGLIAMVMEPAVSLAIARLYLTIY